MGELTHMRMQIAELPSIVTCSEPDCTRPMKARGLCKTHYNQTLPNRHKPRATTCVVCGSHVARYTGGGGRKYGATCSLDCRYALTWGERCELPADHWGRWYGASSPVISAECDWCGSAYCRPFTTAKHCSRRCQRASQRQRRHAAEYNAPGEYRWRDLVTLWIAMGQACAYCLDALPLMALQAEHVVPLSRGGRNGLSNILPACNRCNAEKSDRTPREWDDDRLAHGLHPRAHHIDAGDTRYAHLIIDEPRGLPHRLLAA